MLLNLSNHPSPSWDNYQLQTALWQFGEVIDIAFPNINPNNTEEEIKTTRQAIC